MSGFGCHFVLGLFVPAPVSKPRLNRAREKRIVDDIVVDCYTADERAMGWYYYLEGRLSFPFTARCIAPRSVSPLKKGEEVKVVTMAREEDCLAGMFVLVDFAGRRAGVPLAQLQPVKMVRTVWIVEPGTAPRLVTAYPLERNQ